MQGSTFGAVSFTVDPASHFTEVSGDSGTHRVQGFLAPIWYLQADPPGQDEQKKHGLTVTSKVDNMNVPDFEVLAPGLVPPPKPRQKAHKGEKDCQKGREKGRQKGRQIGLAQEKQHFGQRRSARKSGRQHNYAESDSDTSGDP